MGLMLSPDSNQPFVAGRKFTKNILQKLNKYMFALLNLPPLRLSTSSRIIIFILSWKKYVSIDIFWYYIPIFIDIVHSIQFNEIQSNAKKTFFPGRVRITIFVVASLAHTVDLMKNFM